MDSPRSRHELSEDMVQYILLNYYGRDKSQTPQSADELCCPQPQNVPREESDDDASRWEFYAPKRYRSCESASSSSKTLTVTPAQEIINRYRAGLPLEGSNSKHEESAELPMDGRNTTPDESVEFPVGDSETTPEGNDSFHDSELSSAPVSWKTCSNGDLSGSADCGSNNNNYGNAIESQDLSPKITHRHSVQDLLHEARAEAYEILKTLEQLENEVITCHRPGCSDTVRDVKALMYHLHIHNIEARTRTYECERCHGCYDTRRELSMHLCIRERLRSLPSSPIAGQQFHAGHFQIFSTELM
ncbi:hypothetical protein BDQ17DRAFT_1542803 [Cyathus striatus]|nr:hypothetical protein BDQ17DRAFT_1542803 [Cyathus striatus]